MSFAILLKGFSLFCVIGKLKHENLVSDELINVKLIIVKLQL